MTTVAVAATHARAVPDSAPRRAATPADESPHASRASAPASVAFGADPSDPGASASPKLAELPEKRYFRIGEVARIVGVEAHVLRYWEREFRQIRPEKSQRGQRVYSRVDVTKLQTIRELLYTHGFTIAGAKKRLSTRTTESDLPETTASAGENIPATQTSASTPRSTRPRGRDTNAPQIGGAKTLLQSGSPVPLASLGRSEPHAPTRAVDAPRDDARMVIAATPAIALKTRALSDNARRELVALRGELRALLSALES